MMTKGWGKILKFTYLQNIRSKPFIISTVVVGALMILMVLGINFLPGLLGGDGGEDIFGGGEETGLGIDRVYLLDESGLTPDYSALSGMGATVELVGREQYEALVASIATSDVKQVTAAVSLTEYGYDILISRPENSDIVSSGDAGTVGAVIAASVKNANLIALGVDPADLARANITVSTQVTVAGEAPKSMVTEIVDVLLPTISSIVLFMFIFSYGTLVAQAIATEKTSRVMELLLTSVRPLAVIIGKIAAIGLVSITQIAVLGLCTTVTMLFSAPFGLLGQVLGSVPAAAADVETQMIVGELQAAFANINLLSIVWIVIIFILGFLFYALLAGLIGASVSRIEDLQSAMQPLSLIGVFGFYLAYMPKIFDIETGDSNIFTVIGMYLPISSPFALPSAIMLNEISLLQTVVAVAVLALLDVLMCVLVARVYENIILHTGDRIKLGTLLKMAGSK